MLDHVPGSRIIDPLAFSCMAHVGLNATANSFFSNIKKDGGLRLLHEHY